MTQDPMSKNDSICPNDDLGPEYKLSPIDELYIQTVMKYELQGLKLTDAHIGKEIGRGPKQAWRIGKRPCVLEALKRQRRDAIQVLIDARDGAARRVAKLTKSENERISLDASKEILKSINPETHSGAFDIKTQTTTMTDEEALQYVQQLTKK